VRYWTVGFPVLLTGCMGTTNVLNAVQSELQPAPMYAAIERYPVLKRAPGPSRILSDSTAESTVPTVHADPAVYSDEFWSAVADLDFRGSREVARTEPEARFADAVARLAAGDNEKAESVFGELSTQNTDLNVATGSQMMLATTLLYEHKWSAVRDLLSSLRLNDEDRQHIAGIEVWGRAFGDVEPQITPMPAARVTLPMEMTLVGTPLVRTKINGKEYSFWLDTGSSITVLNSDVAAAAGVSIIAPDTLTIGTFAGVAPARPALLKRMEIGSIAMSNIPVIIIDSHLMRVRASSEGVPWSGLPVDGIIGWDTIRQFDVTLDYEDRKITFQRPENLATRGTPEQNLMWVGKPLVEVRTKSGATLHFTLDTGAQTSFISSQVLKKARVGANNSTARPYGIARTGGQQAQTVSMLSLNVGGSFFVLRNLIVFDPPSSGLINCDGILGSNLAQFGTIRIDATNGLFSIGVDG
jgi:hypothetical protein